MQNSNPNDAAKMTNPQHSQQQQPIYPGVPPPLFNMDPPPAYSPPGPGFIHIQQPGIFYE